MRRLACLAALGLLVSVGVACTDDEPEAGSTTSSSEATGASSTSSAPTTSSSSSTTAQDGTVVVQVFFLDEDAFNVGRAPYVTPVERRVPEDAPIAGALDQLFLGPTAEERAQGLRFVDSGATGHTALEIDGGTVHVRLTGDCSSGGSTFTVADEIAATLRQFREVQAIKIYDPDGETGRPDQPGDSIPSCLEP